MTKKDTPKREIMYVMSNGDDWAAFKTLDELNYWLDFENTYTEALEGYMVEIVKPLNIKLKAEMEE